MSVSGDPAHRLDSLVREVSALLPFPVSIDADMSYTGALFIDLGRRGGPDDPPDTASIDLEMRPTVWMFDVEGGRETYASALGPDADAASIANWIAELAIRFSSPAAMRGE